MLRRRNRKPEYQLKIAKERIQILFSQAGKTQDIKLASRYVQLARKIGMRYNVRIPKGLKRRFCKYCYAFLKPGITSQQRTKDGIVRVKCFNCGKIIRYPIKR